MEFYAFNLEISTAQIQAQGAFSAAFKALSRTNLRGVGYLASVLRSLN
jgi:hypothetical protein